VPPREDGAVALIVRRPAENERELLERGTLDTAAGLRGDCWGTRPSSASNDGGPAADAQVTVMNARAAATVADSDDREQWAIAGDQLYVDLDISHSNLPAGSRVTIGGAVLEITELPHNGCGKFSKRFGADALKFVNSPEGRALPLRGANARVVAAGEIATGDVIRKLG
jgi:MOSC domain-containing protein YiiM